MGALRLGRLAVLLVLAAPASCSPSDAPKPGPVSSGSSNILREDYVGPGTCGRCHPENHARWKQHPHSRMNMPAGPESVAGDFSGVRLSYGQGEATFRRQGPEFLMEYSRQGQAVRTFRVTRTIGWRYLQEYVGVQTRGPEPPGDALYTSETRLKFGYLLRDRRWVPQSYLDPPYTEAEYREPGSVRYDPFEPERSPFNARCVHCHNTYPYELRLYTDDRLEGFPPAPARVIDALLDQRPAFRAQRGNPVLPLDSLVTIGISCESCHFGGREHAKNPKTPIRFVPTHPALAGWTPDATEARKNPAIVNSLCRQCHFSEAGSWAEGSALVNSMESIEQDRGACRSRLRCIDCHNPHERGPERGASDRAESVAACLRCHPRYQSPEAARAHARHEPAAASCLDCHMPRIVHGFDGINRTHRISSPSDPGILESGMANACNLCHLDRSLAWTRDALGAGWGRKVDLPGFLEEVFGKNHARPAGEAWLAQPSGMLRVVAGSAIARSPQSRGALPRLVELLDEPNAYLRMRLLENVEQALGRRLEENEYSLTGPPERRREQLAALLKAVAGR